MRGGARRGVGTPGRSPRTGNTRRGRPRDTGRLIPDAGRRILDPGRVRVARPTPQELAETLRDRANRVRLPGRPLAEVKPGALVEPVVVEAGELGALLRSTGEAPKLVWSRTGSEIVVLTGRITATTVEGGLVVTVPVRTVQTGAVEIQVPLAVGTVERDAGLLASTSVRPLGPAIVVDRWGEAIVALVWRSLLHVAVALAARSGNDEHGDPLVPASLRASEAGFSVVPIARHRKVVR